MSETTVHASKRVYQEYIEKNLGVVLSLLDTEITSSSRGSFDRTWWCWKFTDFSAPRLQEGVYVLSWLLTSSLAPKGSNCHPRLLDQANAAIQFWGKLQHKDGSFDEAYPFERSLAATAFTGFYVGCAIERLLTCLPQSTLDHGFNSLEKLGKWLDVNGEYHGILSNHLAAAAAALQVSGELLGTDSFLTARNRYLDIIYTHQDKKEGWLQEYEGADPGYQTHAMFYLAEIWKRTKNPHLLHCLQRATQFISWFVHPDGSVGGEYASRGTKFVFPAAFEMLSGEVPLSSAIAIHLRNCLHKGRGIGLEQADIWNFFPLLNNYIFALEASKDLINTEEVLPWKTEGAKITFPQAGLVLGHKAKRLMVCGSGLGGVVKVWDTATTALLYEDCGYAMKAGHGFIVSQTRSVWKENKNTSAFLLLEIKAPFRNVLKIRFNPFSFVAFRLFTLTIGRWPLMAKWLKSLLVFTLIRRKKTYKAQLLRTIYFTQEGILEIEDTLNGVAGIPLPLDKHVPLHMGSTRYKDFISELETKTSCSFPKIINRGIAYRKELIK